MILVRKGEHEILRILAHSRHGNGTLYITNMAIAYEVDFRGIYLNFIPHDIVTEFKAHGMLFGAKKFCIVWHEDSTKHTFEFRVKQYKELEETLHKIYNG